VPALRRLASAAAALRELAFSAETLRELAFSAEAGVIDGSRVVEAS
jgi:hypothetical protein